MCSKTQIPFEGYRIETAALFHGEQVPFEQKDEAFSLDLSGVKNPEPDTIVVLTLDKEVERKENSEIHFTGK